MINKPIPNNWVEVSLGEVLKLKNGYAFKSSNYLPKGIPVIRISDIQDGYVKTSNSVFVENILENFIVEKGDILMAMSGATTGKYGIYQGDDIALQNQRVGNFKPYFDEFLSKKFIYYFIGSKKSEIEQKAYGGAQPNISTSLIEGMKLNLPPINEQIKIANKLDLVFKKLSSNKIRLENIPRLLKDFRRNILNTAIKGDLTKDWRNGNEQLYDDELENSPTNEIGWKILKALDSCTKVQSGSTPKNSPFTKTGDVPFLKVYNIQNQKIAFDYKPQFVTSVIHNKKLTRSIVKPNDVLMNIVGPPLGKIAIVTDQYPEWNINQAIVLFRPKRYLISKYLYYVLCDGKQIDNIALELKGSAGQQNISLTQSRNFEFEIPSVEEQKVIVSKIEELFELADKIEAKYLDAKAKIDDLPQAILAKAFRGELVEQDENDEPAEELLKRILEEKQKLKKTKRKK